MDQSIDIQNKYVGLSGVYSLSTTVDKKSNWATFHHYFFSLIIPKSTLQKRSIIYYYLSPLIDLLYPKVHYKSVLLSSKNVAFPNQRHLSFPKAHSFKLTFP